MEIATVENRNFTEVPFVNQYENNSRGIGLVDTISAIKEGRLNCASGELALHVLEVMEKIYVSAKEGKLITIESCPPKIIDLDWSLPLGEIKSL